MTGAAVVGVDRLLDEAHAEDVAVEGDRPVEARADERDVVDAPELEPAGLGRRGFRAHLPESNGTGAAPDRKKNQTLKPTSATVALTTITPSRAACP